MTFTYELDPYPLEIMIGLCAKMNFLPYVKAFGSHKHTDRRNRNYITTPAASRAVKKKTLEVDEQKQGQKNSCGV